MNRIGFILKVREELIDEYKEHHKHVWQEMKDALSSSGWHNYSLFIRNDGMLFGYFETPDSLEAAQAKMEDTKVNNRWQKLMTPYFEIPPGARPDQVLIQLEEIFHID